jgi:hypothetical protein
VKNFGGLLLNYKTRGLSHVYLLKDAIEKCIPDIELVQQPVASNSKSYADSNRCHLGNRRKYLIIVNTIGLRITFGHQMSFKSME